MPPAISIDRHAIGEFCRRRPIRKLAIFGSVLRDDFRADSDIDLSVEFEPDAVVGLRDLAEMELELSGLLGHKVDLRTPAELSRYFRQRVMDSAETLYAHR